MKNHLITDKISTPKTRCIKNNTIKPALEPAQLMLLFWGQIFGVMVTGQALLSKGPGV